MSCRCLILICKTASKLAHAWHNLVPQRYPFCDKKNYRIVFSLFRKLYILHNLKFSINRKEEISDQRDLLLANMQRSKEQTQYSSFVNPIWSRNAICLTLLSLYFSSSFLPLVNSNDVQEGSSGIRFCYDVKAEGKFVWIKENEKTL